MRDFFNKKPVNPTTVESSPVEEVSKVEVAAAEAPVAQSQKPASTKPVSMKKGNSSWKPASLNEFINKEPGYRYRMSRKDPENLAKKAQEGWETVSGIQSGSTKHIASGRINDGEPITSVQEGRDWILQRIPEEVALKRDEYYNGEVERKTSALTAHVKKEVGKSGANVHGEITISSRQGTQVID